MDHEQDRRLVILYSSQTGTAQEVAEMVFREAKRHWFVPQILSIDAFDKRELPSLDIVIFVVATSGQGDPPDSLKPFWRFLLRKDLPLDSLSTLRFALFGLGDSSYQKFNFMGKKLYRRLLQLGATSLIKRGDGDDQHSKGLYGAFDPWNKELWDTLLLLRPLPPDKTIQPKGKLPNPRYIIHFSDEEHKPFPLKQKSKPPYNYYNPFSSLLVANSRITREDWEQDVRHLEFDIDKETTEISYSPGDIINILPENSLKNVNKFLEILNLHNHDADRLITRIEPNETGIESLMHWLPLPLTFRDLVTRYLDITCTPRRCVFEILAHFASDELERERLQEFASANYLDDLLDYCTRESRSILEVLDDFPSIKVPSIHYWMDLVPFIRARPFSISSSLLAHPNRVHVTAAVVKYTTPMGRERDGLCTRYLSHLNPTDKPRVRVWIQKGYTSLPKDIRTPIIMVGPGTGLAMFRSFIQQRNWQRHQMKEGEYVPIGETVFFFGCRHKDKDFMYETEWKEYVENGTLTLFKVAFSRDQKEKIYVQHKILEEGRVVWDLLHNKGAYFYISGNARNMPEDVKTAVQQVFMKEGGLDSIKTEEYMKVLIKKRRWCTETWY